MHLSSLYRIGMSLLLLTISDERLQEGIQRMKDVGIRYGL
jgi:hypothetical protein